MQSLRPHLRECIQSSYLRLIIAAMRAMRMSPDFGVPKQDAHAVHPDR
jgi:hypothetical protein